MCSDPGVAFVNEAVSQKRAGPLREKDNTGTTEDIHNVLYLLYMTHSQMLGKVESGGGPILKVVLEC